jgi:hypothetical protein
VDTSEGYIAGATRIYVPAGRYGTTLGVWPSSIVFIAPVSATNTWTTAGLYIILGKLVCVLW